MVAKINHMKHQRVIKREREIERNREGRLLIGQDQNPSLTIDVTALSLSQSRLVIVIMFWTADSPTVINGCFQDKNTDHNSFWTTETLYR